MSRDLYIYKLKKVGDEIPEVIDYDTEHLPDDYREFGTDYVPRGAEPYGKKVTIKETAIDWDKVCLDRFGKKWRCRRLLYLGYEADYGYEFLDDDGTPMGEVYASEVKSDYSYISSREAIVLRVERISHCDNYYGDDLDDGILCKESLVPLIKSIVDEADSDEWSYEYYGGRVFPLVRAYFTDLEEGESLLTIID